jgi:hypothetical protein
MKTVLVPIDSFPDCVSLYAEPTKVHNLEAIYDIIRVRHEVDILTETAAIYKDHPAVKAWAMCELQLINLGMSILETWSRVPDDLYHIKMFLDDQFNNAESGYMGFPGWFGKHEVHKSHQSELLRIHPLYYQEHFPDTTLDIPLIWS